MMNLDSLPAEVLTLCFEGLPTRTLLKILATSRRLRSVVIELIRSRFHIAWGSLNEWKFEARLEVSKPSDFAITYSAILDLEDSNNQSNSTNNNNSNNSNKINNCNDNINSSSGGLSQLPTLPIVNLKFKEPIKIQTKDKDDKIVYLDFGIERPNAHGSGRPNHSMNPTPFSTFESFVHGTEKRDLKLYENLCNLDSKKMVIEPEGMRVYSEKNKKKMVIEPEGMRVYSEKNKKKKIQEEQEQKQEEEEDKEEDKEDKEINKNHFYLLDLADLSLTKFLVLLEY